MQNSKKQIIWPIVAIVAGVAVLFGATFLFQSNTPEEAVEEKGDIVSFIVDKPDFVIRGHNLAEVKIYGVESPDDITHILLGTGEKSETVGGAEIWRASIPVAPIILSQIYVEAVDTNGNELDRFYFALSGNSDIYTALWLDNPAEVVSVQVGETFNVGTLALEVTEVLRDNRCPVGVACNTGGGVEIALNIKSETFTDSIVIATDEAPVPAAGYIISIEDVTPGSIQGEEILESEYRFVIVVEQESKG